MRGTLASKPVGDDNQAMETVKPTKQRLIDAGLKLLLEHGYNSLGIQAILDATELPKGSFYHHFKDKQDFALQVIDAYITEVHGVLDACLTDTRYPPLARVRNFFEIVMQKYREEGYLGCLMGGLGQELSGTSDVFRQKIEWCFLSISERIASCFEEAKARGDIPVTSIRSRWPIFSSTAGKVQPSEVGCGRTRFRLPTCSTSYPVLVNKRTSEKNMNIGPHQHSP